MSLHASRSIPLFLQHVERSLRRNGVAALPLLGNVLGAIHQQLPYDIVVDSLPEITAGLAKSPLVPDMPHIEEVFTVFAQNPTALGNLLTKQNIVDWDKRILFKPVHHSWLDVLKASTCKYGKWKNFNDYNSYFIMHCNNMLELETEREREVCGFYLGSLQPAHASVIARRFDASQEDTMDYYASQIQHGFSVAVYENTDPKRYSGSSISNEHPVAYCLSSDDMSLIALFVSPEHRRKGLGEWVIAAFSRKMRAFNLPTFGYIDPQNIASERTAQKAGGVIQPGKWYWMEFIPHHHCN